MALQFTSLFLCSNQLTNIPGRSSLKSNYPRSRTSWKPRFQDYCGECPGIIDRLLEGYGNGPSWDDTPNGGPFRPTSRPPGPQPPKRPTLAPRPRPTAAPAPELKPQVFYVPAQSPPINIKINSNSVSNSNWGSNPRPKWLGPDNDLNVRPILLKERRNPGWRS